MCRKDVINEVLAEILAMSDEEMVSLAQSSTSSGLFDGLDKVSNLLYDSTNEPVCSTHVMNDFVFVYSSQGVITFQEIDSGISVDTVVSEQGVPWQTVATGDSEEWSLAA
ncbi:hypothetical protein JCM15519_02970 [Fundidesulfovibrio butyratiphilus]